MAQVAQTGNVREELRQRSVAQILGIPESAAKTEHYRAEAEAKVGEPALKERLEMIKQYKTPEEINKLKAETDRAWAAGKLDDAQRKEITELLEEKKRAEVLKNNKLVQEINNKLAVLFPKAGKPGEFETGLVDPRDLAEFMTRKTVAEIGAEGRGDLGAEKFDVQKEQTAVDIDTIIRKDPKSPEALARYSDFNRYSNRPMAAVNNGGRIEYINLPKVGGKIITARKVYAAAAALNMSVEQYLTDVLQSPEAMKMFSKP